MSPARPGRRRPNPREIETVTIGEREKFQWRKSDAGTRQRRAGNVRPSDRTTFTAPANVARTQATRPLHHLHFAVMAPYNAALVERASDWRQSDLRRRMHVQ